MRIIKAAMAATSLAVLLSACSQQVPSSEEVASAESAVELAEFPDQVLWGDTHLHTDNSIDAFGFGVRLGPEDALKFARGDEVTATNGMQAKLDRPLDFLVISDHSDALGATRRLYDAPRMLIRDPTLRRWHDMMHESPEQSQRAIGELIDAAAQGTLPDTIADPEEQAEATKEIWTRQLELLEQYYEPGTFTPLAGYEWTLMPDGNNLHRVVMFRDGFDKTSQVLPFGALGGTTVDELWDSMEAYEESTGGQVIAIPHNPNLSNGIMFELTDTDGRVMGAEYAARRARMEPVVEVTQIKGDSESHPFLSPNDEFAGFGDAGWELGNLPVNIDKQNDMFAGEYIREALKRGLSIEERTGANPYKFGMIGSTDSHTALATADEDNFFGKHTGNEPNGERAMQGQNLGTREGRFGWHYLASGYAAVWARGNTRGEIFDAMKRREVYATTGPRMTVRLFGGFDFTDDAFEGDWIRAGYETGVPMGGELEQRGGDAPIFLVSALKDPDGANLDRLQIVKGWIDAGGNLQERVFDISWSDPENRQIRGGKLDAVGDTVDRENATYTNDIGTAELRTVWRDPTYRPGERAFYYVRVLQIPTPRWPLFDAVRFGIELPEEVVTVSQERAYTSPIWIKPAAVAGEAG